MPQWEYERINLSELARKGDEIDLLNDAGADGWELVAITLNNVAYLKRELEGANQAPLAGRRTASSRQGKK